MKETCGKAKCIIEDKQHQRLTLADLYKQLIHINLSVQDTRNILVRHVKETHNKFAKIEDEIVSLKKHSSPMCSPTDTKIDEFSDKTTHWYKRRLTNCPSVCTNDCTLYTTQ